ncbi:MAG: hypothetical protein D6801_06225 [Alphaproteobacteria bacterium]|nr:MAG: hypothetical protein D6801_06225 [Alphaproteobacteria bacterium]
MSETMRRDYTVEMLLAEVPGLTGRRLERFARAGIVTRVERGAAPYRAVDRARLALACELADAFDLEDEALAMVLDLVDRMHSARADLRALMGAVAAEPEEVRVRMLATMRRLRG